MSAARQVPPWAEDLRRRYLRGEASMFVLHGNVYDVVLHGRRMLSLTEFLTDVMLSGSKETIAVYNVATGVRFAKREAGVAAGLEDLLLATDKARVFAALERLLVGGTKTAVLVEYAEAVAPAGDPSFQGDADRAAIVTLHRWSALPEIERGDNVVLLVAENLTDLAPKLVSNPKVAVVEIPMPDRETSRTSRNRSRPASTRPVATSAATSRLSWRPSAKVLSSRCTAAPSADTADAPRARSVPSSNGMTTDDRVFPVAGSTSRNP